MDTYLWQYVLKCRPFAKKEDVQELRELNKWDLLIVFSDGEKIVYDRFTGFFRGIPYQNKKLTERQEKNEFKRNLRNLMARQRISQEDLADILGTTQEMISRYINGDCIPNCIRLRQISKVLNCSMDDFFYQEY